MAYDRYDNRRDRDWRGSDYDRPSATDRGGYRRDERGFWERAGDEVASWFGDDDAERRRREDERMNRDRGGYSSGITSGGWSRDRDYGRDFDRDRDRYAYRGSGYGRDWDRSRPSGWSSSDRDYRSGRSGYAGYDRDMSYRGGFAGSSNPDYMSPTGPSFGYGGTYGAGNDRGYGSGGFGRDFEGHDRDNDRHYRSWRNQQMDELDRDYDRYNRERQDRFENDFGSWRQNRMTKRGHLGSVREHMDVVGSDGETVGKVDCVKGDRIILTKSDSPDNRHHALDCSMIQSVEGDQVRLDMPAEEAKSRWDDLGSRGLSRSDRERERDEDTNLNRSFAGTYEDER
jgi:hypothetical protein